MKNILTKIILTKLNLFTNILFFLNITVCQRQEMLKTYCVARVSNDSITLGQVSKTSTSIQIRILSLKKKRRAI